MVRDRQTTRLGPTHLLVGCLAALAASCGGQDQTILLPAGEPASITTVATAVESVLSDAGLDTVGFGGAGSGCSPSGDRPPQLRCEGEQLFSCSPEGLWEANETCATSQLCDDSVTLCRVSPESCANATPSCLQPVCEKLDLRCSGRVSEICNEGRTGFQLLSDCGQPCDGSVCDPGVGCRAQFCDPGEYDCLNGPDAPPTFCNSTCSAFTVTLENASMALSSYCNGHNSGE